MPRYLPTAALAAFTLLGATGAFAQQRSMPPPVLVKQASAAGGRIQGVVRDDLGKVVGGANIVALGTTLAAARSDVRGKFLLMLPAGEYILRATRDGYVSTYREPVRVQTSVSLERNITLIRQSQLEAAAVGTIPVLAEDTEHAHSDAAWWLRHLPRTVLRDGTEAGAGIVDDGRANSEFAPNTSFFDRSARAASAFFKGTDFRGQVNLLTTGSLSASADGWLPENWSRGIAYVAVGAPVGSSGEWVVRGAMSPGDATSWTLLGEFASGRDRIHAMDVGVSFSTQAFLTPKGAPMTVGSTGTRSVGGAYLSDRWRMFPRVALEYGARVDRYDYVVDPLTISPRLGAEFAISRWIRVRVDARQRTFAPGADEFLPPVTAGPWLPPERTFSPLIAGGTLAAERVRRFEAGVDFALDANGSRTIGVRRFAESTANQIATIFGLDAASAAGHYYVSTPGDVEIEGWLARFDGRITRRVDAHLTYSVGDADWDNTASGRALRWLVPSAARHGTERLHDFTSTLGATLPTSTRITLGYRVNALFTRSRAEGRTPAADNRFDFEVRQELPYQPIHGSVLDVVFAARTLLGDLRGEGSMYDELLTVAPPMRLMGGLQVRF